MTSSLLSVRDLWVHFKVHDSLLDAVRGVSFDIRRGKTLALVGESGSGKSVIARAILGILPDIGEAYKGQVVLHEQDKEAVDLLSLNPDGRRMRGYRGGSIAMIFQEPMVSLSPLHTVGNQVSEALHLHRSMSVSEGKNLCLEMLRMTGFAEPATIFNAYPFELSGGMRQRAMIAMALVCRPALLIADEPTTALDVTIQAQILGLINDLQAELDMSVLMITHDLGVVANVADDVVVIYHGEVMERGSVDTIFSSPQHPYTRALMQAVPRIDMGAEKRLVPIREIHAEVGEFLETRRQKIQKTPASLANSPLLQVSHLNKSFYSRGNAWSWSAPDPSVHAVNDVSLAIGRGECLGLVGESGSGKSTLGKLIVRAMSADSGSIVLNSVDQQYEVESLSDQRLFEYRSKVQYMFQDPVGSLNPSMTVFDILREPMIIHKLGNRTAQSQMCRELMQLVGLDPRFLRRYPHSFSGGQRQRIGIARALALQPDLLICDEPVSALDVSIQAQVLNLMRDLRRELGLSYLFISHNLAVVDYIADQVAVMYRGRIVEIAPADNLFNNATHPYTRNLLRAVPVADLNSPLDFADITNSDSNDDWPAPFRENQDHTARQSDQLNRLHEVSPGHLVRAESSASLDDIRAGIRV